MDSFAKLQEICLRLDHIESAGEWLSRALVHQDGAASHTGSLITVLADDIRDRLMELIAELEGQIKISDHLH